MGIFTNLGYKFNENTIFSSHLRGDKHKYSQENITYRLNLTKLIDNFTLSLSESTGLRHPDLYVLHGESNSGTFKSMATTKPETSLTRELSLKYNLSSNVSFKTTAYKGTISDVLNRGTNTNGYNEIIDIKQEGLENSLFFNNNYQKFKLFNTFSKSREGDGTPQLRRPEQQFGAKYSRKFISNIFGPVDFNYDYRHVGKVEDWKNGSVRAKVDGSDIMNLSITKDFYGNKWTLNIFNLTDEAYQRPDTYNQEGRRIGLSFRNKY